MGEAKFHLPGLRQNYPLNMLAISMYEQKPEMFREGVKIESCYGEFPTSLWNGGRPSYNDQCSAEYIINVIKSLNSHGVSVRLTYTNMTINEHELSDPYCNFCLDQLAKDEKNCVILFSPILEEYIRNKYPNMKIVSSTCKRIKDIDKVNEELEKPYHLVVLDYDFNNDYESLAKIHDHKRCEVLVNCLCTPNCPRRSDHYKNIAENQRLILKNRTIPADHHIPLKQWHCEYGEHNCYYTIQDYKTFIKPEDVVGKYSEELDIHNFKIEGRTGNLFSLVETYSNFLIKPEYQGLFRIQVLNNLKANKIVSVNKPLPQAFVMPGGAK